MFTIAKKERRALETQRWIGIGHAPLVVPFFWTLLRWVQGYRIENVSAFRKKLKGLLNQTEGKPLLICSNHLTMIDSLLIAWCMHSPMGYVLDYRKMPWNLPEASNFAQGFWLKMMCYLGKCVYVERSGSLASKKMAMIKTHYLLTRGEPVLVFPEGGRSRSGRVDPKRLTTGVGRLVTALPETRVLCLYMRGKGQKTYSFFPAKNETFYVDAKLLPAHSREDLEADPRRARSIAEEVMQNLVELENKYFSSKLPD